MTGYILHEKGFQYILHLVYLVSKRHQIMQEQILKLCFWLIIDVYTEK
jgi:hypothetical protein